MRISEFEIIPLKGLGPLAFGLPFDEVMRICGEPEQTEVIRDTDEIISTVLWLYPSAGIRLYFEGMNPEALACCEIDNPKATLFDKPVFTMTEDQIIELMSAHGYNDIERELETWGETRLSYEDALIDFYYEQGSLLSVSFGVFINSDGHVEWPVVFYQNV